MRKLFWAALFAVWLIAPLALQAQGDYLDVYIVQVKPDKVAEFESVARKISDANRRNNGDNWLTAESMYGEADTYMFTSGRKDYADVDKANDTFMAAIHKAFGNEGAPKILNEWESCLASSRTELRKRRWDLSRKAPTDPEGYAKLISESRVLRTIAVHVRPGHVPEFEDLLKQIKAASEQNPNTGPVLVSEVIEGGKGNMFYVSYLRNSLGAFDSTPSMHEVLGDEGYKKYVQISADAIEGTESRILRFDPELSNPPQEIVAMAPDFWQPKPMVAEHAKAKTKAVEPAAERTKQ